MKTRYILFGIVIIAFLLRLFYLGKTPLALEWDEVALGYDAYSILTTGKDQFGKFLPSTFRSLDDYKPPIYEYLTVPSVFIFGLTPFATRLPSAVFGSLAVVMTFFLGQTIFSKISVTKNYSIYISLLSSLLLAVSPWHLQFSRAAFEVNVSVFITISAIVLFLRGLTSPKLFFISALLFGIDLFSYHSTRVVSPLLLITLFYLFNRKLPPRRIVGIFLAIYILFIILVFPILISKDAQIRFTATNIFTPGARYLDEKDLPRQFLQERIKDENAGFAFAGKIFHNARLIYTDYDTLKKALGNYLSNFSFEYLFVKGDAPLHHAPGFGLLYILELPFLVVGIVFLLLKGFNRYSAFTLLWMAVAPITNAVTREAPHAVRTELILPTYQLFTAFGMSVVFMLLQKQSRWAIVTGITCITFLFVISLASYLHQYYVHTNYEFSKFWMSGRKEAVEYTERHKNEYEKIYVSLHLEMPHMFWLFYTKYPPPLYLAQGGTVSGGFADERNHFDKYYFRNFTYPENPSEGKILYVGLPRDFPPGVAIKETIYYLNGEKAIIIAE
ncbi:glycosyltransferase family 39 protein [Candidatus Gottesmanbacteria bacterium]|nr:glycosyltransferase family 39 protein [Candidatus Gottesmanbacteria bacterium]